MCEQDLASNSQEELICHKPNQPTDQGGCPRGVLVKALDCGIVVLQSLYYVHFRTNTLGKGMSPLILPAIG